MAAEVGCGKGEWRGINKRCTEGFRAENMLCLILSCWLYVIIYLSKPTECMMPRVSPNVNYRLWVIMVWQRRFISCNKCTALVRDVGNGGGYAYMEAGDYETSLHSP